jgi:hypothetical protein
MCTVLLPPGVNPIAVNKYTYQCHEIWEPKRPATLWATPGMLWDTFTVIFICRTFKAESVGGRSSDNLLTPHRLYNDMVQQERRCMKLHSCRAVSDHVCGTCDNSIDLPIYYESAMPWRLHCSLQVLNSYQAVHCVKKILIPYLTHKSIAKEPGIRNNKIVKRLYKRNTFEIVCSITN